MPDARRRAWRIDASCRDSEWDPSSRRDWWAMDDWERRAMHKAGIPKKWAGKILCVCHARHRMKSISLLCPMSYECIGFKIPVQGSCVRRLRWWWLWCTIARSLVSDLLMWCKMFQSAVALLCPYSFGLLGLSSFSHRMSYYMWHNTLQRFESMPFSGTSSYRTHFVRLASA